ncbi:hypothetical protein NBRC116591_21430 [Sessilibacter corallicola]|uniref:Uncharacterized protein n=1 Tax=Sessilibacter corallicola TaxID=2904075 RepID=A0ABQ0A9T3_9GAMM
MCAVQFLFTYDTDFFLTDIRQFPNSVTDHYLNEIAKELLKYRRSDLTEYWTEEEFHQIEDDIGHLIILQRPEIPHEQRRTNYLLLIQRGFPKNSNSISCEYPADMNKEELTYKYELLNLYRDAAYIKIKNADWSDNIPNGVEVRRIIYYLHNEINIYLKENKFSLEYNANAPENIKIYLKKSVSEFLKNLGYKESSITASKRRETKQILHLLFNCKISIQTIQDYLNTRVEIEGELITFRCAGQFKNYPSIIMQSSRYIPFSVESKLWDDTEKEEEAYIVLHPTLFSSAAHYPHIIDYKKVTSISGSISVQNIYSYLCENLPKLKSKQKVYIAEANLMGAFGGNYSDNDKANYLSKFTKNLSAALDAYPEAKNSVIMNDYLLAITRNHEKYNIGLNGPTIHVKIIHSKLALIRVITHENEEIHEELTFSTLIDKLSAFSKSPFHKPENIYAKSFQSLVIKDKEIDKFTFFNDHSSLIEDLIKGLVDRVKLPKFLSLSYCKSPYLFSRDE